MAINYSDDQYHLLGLALYAAQRVEFVLYGIASHAARTPAAQKEKRFRDLTPEKFLRGNPDELKATLGQLVEVFGDTLLIRTPELIAFYKDRNLIAHDFARTFRMNIHGAPHHLDSREFLLNFLERAWNFENILRGLLAELLQAAARQLGREAEFTRSADDLNRVNAYHDTVAKYLSTRGTDQK